MNVTMAEISKYESDFITSSDFSNLISDIKKFLNTISPHLGNNEIISLKKNASMGRTAMKQLMNKIMLLAQGVPAFALCPQTPEMDRLHVMILFKNHTYLCRNVIFSNVVPLLTEEQILTEEDTQEIRADPCDKRRVERLLNVLPRKGPHAYHTFRRALVESSAWVVQGLDDTTIDKNDAEKYMKGITFHVMIPAVKDRAMALALQYSSLLDRECKSLAQACDSGKKLLDAEREAHAALVEEMRRENMNIRNEMRRLQDENAQKVVELERSVELESTARQKLEHKYEEREQLLRGIHKAHREESDARLRKLEQAEARRREEEVKKKKKWCNIL